jgi:hypothetical protein
MATRKKTDSSNGNDGTPKRTARKSTLSNVSVMPQVNMEEEIRRRAYEIYEERGGTHGLDQDDWYRAEQEVAARYGRRSA